MNQLPNAQIMLTSHSAPSEINARPFWGKMPAPPLTPKFARIADKLVSLCSHKHPHKFTNLQITVVNC